MAEQKMTDIEIMDFLNTYDRNDFNDYLSRLSAQTQQSIRRHLANYAWYYKHNTSPKQQAELIIDAFFKYKQVPPRQQNAREHNIHQSQHLPAHKTSTFKKGQEYIRHLIAENKAPPNIQPGHPIVHELDGYQVYYSRHTKRWMRNEYMNSRDFKLIERPQWPNAGLMLPNAVHKTDPQNGQHNPMAYEMATAYDVPLNLTTASDSGLIFDSGLIYHYDVPLDLTA